VREIAALAREAAHGTRCTTAVLIRPAQHFVGTGIRAAKRGVEVVEERFQGPGVDPDESLVERQPSIAQDQGIFVFDHAAQAVQRRGEGLVSVVGLDVGPQRVGDLVRPDVVHAERHQHLEKLHRAAWTFGRELDGLLVAQALEAPAGEDAKRPRPAPNA
jgi:hypothetical protein